jgi:hypothetical protein
VPHLPRPRLPHPRFRRRPAPKSGPPEAPGTESPAQAEHRTEGPPAPAEDAPADLTPTWQWPSERPRYRLFPEPPRPRPAEPDRTEAPAQPRAERRAGHRAGGRLGDVERRISAGAGAVGRVPAAAGRGASEFWFSLSLHARRRLAAAGAVVVAVVLILLIAVPALPCEAPGGDVCPPSDDAIHLVPGNSLAYLHMNVDHDTSQYKAAQGLASRLPLLTQQVIGRLTTQLPGPHGNPLDFGRDIEPWFGGEAALALIPAGGGAAEEVQLLEASDSKGGQAFANSISSGKTQTSSYRGVDVQVDRRGLATALVGGFLAIGRESGIRDVIDAHSGAKGTSSLADDPAATAARDALPDERLADAYLSRTGIARLVDNPHAPLSSFAAAISPSASRGAAAALIAKGSGLDLDVRSGLDPGRAKAHAGFFAAFPSFKPTLSGSLPAGSLGYLGFGDPGAALRALLGQADSQEPGLAAAVGKLADSVKKLGNVNLESDLLPSLGGEAAFALEPNAHGAAPSGAPPSGVNLSSSQTPSLVFLGGGIDPGRANKALAALGDPLAKALGGGGKGFTAHKVDDVTAHTLKLSSSVDLTYAIVESALVVATDPAAVEQIAAGEGGLSDAGPYREATGGLPGSLSVIGYANLQGLVTLAEQAGLASSPAYATFAPEIRRLDALGLGVQSSSAELATDLRLVVGPSAG